MNNKPYLIVPYKIFKELILFFLCITFFLNIGKVDVYAQSQLQVKEFDLPYMDGSPWDIVVGDNNEIWFTELLGNKIGRITLDGNISEFDIPTGDSRPISIAIDSLGNIWFSESNTNKIGKITTNGQVEEFELKDDMQPNQLVVDQHNNIWFTIMSKSSIGKMTFTDSGISVFEYKLSNQDALPEEITMGKNGEIWFTEQVGKIGKITNDGIITEYSVISEDTHPNGIVMDASGNIWFTLQNGNVGRLTPSYDLMEYNHPFENRASYSIAVSPNGNLWFAEWAYDSVSMVGEVTSDGVITDYSVPKDVRLMNIAITSDGKVWYTNSRFNKIGYFEPLASVNDILNVPYFSQNSEPWGSSEYDHAKYLGLMGKSATMDRWGCAVTSVAMILRYHNINETIDGKVIDPGTLNEWLKNNKGYSYGYGKDGWYSYLNWPSVGNLTKQLYEVGKSTIKLEHRRAYPSVASTKLLNDDLTVGNSFGPFPDILFVNNSGHFVVAKGLLDDTYAINDPEWGYEALSSFSNIYSQVDRYVPSQTNLSYIALVINPDVEILITDGQGRRTGGIIEDGQLTKYEEIPDATYAFMSPIENTDDSGDSQMLGTGVNELLLPIPDDGDYAITLTGNSNSFYTLNASIFKENGENELITFYGSVTPEQSNDINIQYSQTDDSVVGKVVSLDLIKADLDVLYSLGLINKKGVYNSLVKKLDFVFRVNNHKSLADALKPLKNELSAQRGKHVSELAYKILIEDIDLFISNSETNSN